MTLAQILPNSFCRVLSAAEQHPELQSRFYALGLFPGADIEVLRYAPVGDPVQVKVGRTLLSIRKQEALLVEVEIDAEIEIAVETTK